MALLVAAEGRHLDAQVARRFEKAAWFLIIDPRSFTVETFHHALPHDQDGLLRRAGAEGITGVLTGGIGPMAFGLIRAQEIPVYTAEGLTVRQAVDRANEGVLSRCLEPDRRAPATGEVTPGRLRAAGASRSRFGRRRVTDAGESGRGRHRLQQYSGRGH